MWVTVIEEWEVGPAPDYGRHSGTRIANLRNRGLLQESQIVWGMDLVPYTPTNNPRHSAAVEERPVSERREIFWQAIKAALGLGPQRDMSSEARLVAAIKSVWAVSAELWPDAYSSGCRGCGMPTEGDGDWCAECYWGKP